MTIETLFDEYKNELKALETATTNEEKVAAKENADSIMKTINENYMQTDNSKLSASEIKDKIHALDVIKDEVSKAEVPDKETKIKGLEESKIKAEKDYIQKAKAEKISDAISEAALGSTKKTKIFTQPNSKVDSKADSKVVREELPLTELDTQPNSKADSKVVREELQNKGDLTKEIENLTKKRNFMVNDLMKTNKKLSKEEATQIVDNIVIETTKRGIEPLEMYSLMKSESSGNPNVKHAVLPETKGVDHGLMGVNEMYQYKTLTNSDLPEFKGKSQKEIGALLEDPALNIKAAAYIYANLPQKGTPNKYIAWKGNNEQGKKNAKAAHNIFEKDAENLSKQEGVDVKVTDYTVLNDMAATVANVVSPGINRTPDKAYVEEDVEYKKKQKAFKEAQEQRKKDGVDSKKRSEYEKQFSQEVGYKPSSYAYRQQQIQNRLQQIQKAPQTVTAPVINIDNSSVSTPPSSGKGPMRITEMSSGSEQAKKLNSL
jgi:hypothetical protein